MKNQKKVISIIGFGNVGKCILQQLLCCKSDNFCINIMEPEVSAFGSFLDLSHASFINNCHHLVWNSEALLKDSLFIFHCAGVNVPLNSDRLSIAEKSIALTSSIFKHFTSNVDPIIIVIANPVDVISTLVYKLTGLNSSQIIGTGTFLDTIRMNYYVQQTVKDQNVKINTLLLGEHGTSIALIKSRSFINQKLIEDVLDKKEIETCFDQTKKAAATIKKTQRATYYAVAGCAMDILKGILHPTDKILPLSVLLPIEYQRLFQCTTLFMSIPAKLTQKGAFPEKKLEYHYEELEALKLSAQQLSKHVNFNP